jgi:hypothetical protein
MNSTNSTGLSAAYMSVQYFYISLECILVLSSFFSLVCILVFRNYEPIKGRRVTSGILTLALLILETVRVSLWWLDYEGSQIRGSVELALLVMIFFSLCYMCIQYIVRSWVNEYKKSSYTKVEDINKNKKRVIIANFITSNITFGIVFMALALEQSAISAALIYLNAQPVVPASVNIGGFASGFIHCFVWIAIIVAVYVADIILDVKKNGCCNGYYARDSLNYRIDAIWIILVVVFVIIYSVFQLTTVPGDWRHFLPIVIFDILFRYCLILAGGLSCVLVLFKRFITRKIMNSEPDNTNMTRTEQMKKVLTYPKFRDIFEIYCHSELSTENIKAYHDLQKYANTKDEDEKRDLARLMYYKYVQPNAVMEVNMPQHVRVKIRNVIEKLSDVDIVPDKLYFDFECEVVINLTDTFSRFMLSDMYRRMRRRQSFTLVPTPASELMQYTTLSTDTTPTTPISPITLESIEAAEKDNMTTTESIQSPDSPI